MTKLRSRRLRDSAAVAVLAMAACGGSAEPAASPESSPAIDGGAAPAARAKDGSSATAAASDDTRAPAPAGKYRIVLDRPTKLGAKRKRTVTVTDSRAENLVQDKKTLRDVDHRVRLSLVADEEVVAMGSDGDWSKLKITLQSFAAAGAKGDEPILPPGTVLTIERPAPGAKAKITSSSGELTKDQAQAVALAVPSGPSGPRDDAVFGTQEPQAPGASWNIMLNAAVRDLAGFGAKTSPELVKGNTTLVSVREDRGEPCLELTARLEAKIVELAGIPDGATIDDGLLTAEATSVAPVDTRRQAHRTSNRVGLHLVAKIPVKGSTATLKLDTLTVTETSFEDC